MDKIIITDLQAEAMIGALDWEKKVTQKILINLEIGIDAKQAAATDQLKDAIDYAAIVKLIQTFLNAHRYQLLETLAEYLTNELLAQFKMPYLKLMLRKVGILANVKEVAVVIERGT